MRSCCIKLAAIACLLFFASCGDNTSHLFTLLDNGRTGINFKNTIYEDGPLNVLNYTYFYNGGGVAIGDINNDGLQDILFTGNMVKNRLYLNKGGFNFEDITEKSGVAAMQGWCTGATMADVNGDGKLDIYICRSADGSPDRRKNLLFINNGDNTFTEKAQEFGLDDKGFSTQAAFFDYDKDGDLDCFIINHSLQKYTTGAMQNPELRNQRNPDFASKLYRNDNGHFTDVSLSAGITSNVFSFGLGIVVSDINNDGWPDVYLTNDFNEPDYLFMNNRNGTFTEELPKHLDQTSLYSMGVDAADFNNDGLIDIATLDMLPEDNQNQKMHSGAENFDKFQYLFSKGFYYQYSRNMLQKNNGDGSFSEIAQMAGVSNTDWSWSALFGDYDNDGNKDLFITNGYVKDYTDMDFLKYNMSRAANGPDPYSSNATKDFIDSMPGNAVPNYVFKNNGDETFTKQTANWGLDQNTVSAGAAYVDLDNDGDLDLVINNSNGFAGIYKNNASLLTKNNYLRVVLQGGSKNSRGIGAKVKLFSGNKIFYQEESPVRGFQSSVDPVLNFGLGKITGIDSAVIIWPDDKVQKLAKVGINQTLAIRQQDASGIYRYDSTGANTNSIFSTAAMPQLKHTENLYNDFSQQKLMPNYLSRPGPCMAAADVNKDGTEDVFLGGASGQPCQLLLQGSNGSFTPKPQPAFIADASFEAASAIFFDADGDGVKDLYVASGGYEFAAGSATLQDRLYINNGSGTFVKKLNALPNMPFAKGCVTAADIDGDGDIDLFVGGRVIPGQYPLPPRSYILLNDGKGNFADATQLLCPALLQPGMVTGATWIDVNKDKQPDLVIAGEWMPIKVFVNNHGHLTDASAQYIPFASTGWWNTVYAADLDGDGDEDIVVGNCGLNTQFKASEKEPLSLYYKDFDENGIIDPVLCYYINGVQYPAASRDDLTDQLPMLKKKFLAYKSYSNATINDIFTPNQLQGATVLNAVSMQTVYLENNGSQGFIKHQLPIQAQYAPVYAVTATEVDRDGKKDLILGGNNFYTRIKFGRYTANHGVLLKNKGSGNFEYISQNKSGLNIKGEMRSLQSVLIKNKQNIIAGINNGQAVLLTPRK